jgi:hypothetical protein
LEESNSELESPSSPSEPFKTITDGFGVYRQYSFGTPSITPDAHLSNSELTNSPYLALNPSTHLTSTKVSSAAKENSVTEERVTNWFAPFKNPSTFHLMNWFTSSSTTKSMTELDSLVRDVLQFKPEELAGFRAAKENARLDSFKFSDNEDSVFDDTWIKGTIYIPLPCDGVRQSEDDAPLYPVTFYYRKILDVIKAAFSELDSKGFHTFPFRAYWHPSKTEPPERVYSESYTANMWNKEYDNLNNSREDRPNHDLETFIIALMIWSDSTHLAQFGTASLWPIYLYIGNQSKYTCAKPTSMSAHHLAYLPKVRCCSFVYSHY